jgi:hypothetical protein
MNMSVRDGVIPTALGTIVTATGATLVAKKISPALAAGILGYGLAHVVLGSIDLVEHKHKGLFG